MPKLQHQAVIAWQGGLCCAQGKCSWQLCIMSINIFQAGRLALRFEEQAAQCVVAVLPQDPFPFFNTAKQGTSALPMHFGSAYFPSAVGLPVHWKSTRAFICSTGTLCSSRAVLVLELAAACNLCWDTRTLPALPAPEQQETGFMKQPFQKIRAL